MKPYYKDSAVTIYHGDCRDIVPQLGRFDLLLTDPPYPNLKGGTKVTFTSGVGKRHVTNATVGTPWGNDLTGVSLSSEHTDLGAIVFCSYHSVCELPSFVNMEKIALVSWFQRNAMPSICNAPHFQCEYAWAFKKKPGLVWRKLKTHYDIARLQSGCMATERYCTDGVADHPTQKPVSLMSQLLSVGGETVIDPYMGTGTTLRAAKDLNRKATGIEISEKYCEIAANRMCQEVLELKP